MLLLFVYLETKASTHAYTGASKDWETLFSRCEREGEKNLDCTEDDEEREIIGRLRHRIAALYRSNERKGRFARYAWEVGGLERKEED